MLFRSAMANAYAQDSAKGIELILSQKDLDNLEQGLFTSLNADLMAKSELSLGNDFLSRSSLHFLQIQRSRGFLNFFGHSFGHLCRLSQQVRRTAELVPFGVPEEIQQQEMVFTGSESGATAHHLAVQAPHLCRTEYHNAVHRGTIPSFSKQH